MATAIELSELGMINDMRLLDTISHNLANANTTGYKRDIAVSRGFDSLLSSQLVGNLQNPDGSERQLIPAMQLLVDYSSGVLQHTGNPLDLTIEGEAFFELNGSDGLRYSRQGAFQIDATGRLVGQGGETVSGVEGAILLSGGEVTIDPDGSVFENGDFAGTLKLVAFENTTQLAKSGSGLMQASDGVVFKVNHDSSVRQGYQETSNVNVMEEMVQMLTTLRHFETTSKVLKGYDDMVSTAISTIAEF